MKLFLQMLFTATVLMATGLQPSKAQTIPNSGFENWITGNFDIPANYPFTSNPSTFLTCDGAFSVEKVADPYHGAFALRLTTRGNGENACFGFIINAIPGDNPFVFKGGFPYTEKPTGIRGYYKSTIPAGDSAFMLFIFKLAGNVIGLYETRLYGTKTTYTLFDYTFPTALPVNPDSVIFAITSSDVFNGIAIDGSMIQVDSISFKGVTSQPALMNGSFENWQAQTLYKPVGPWFFNQVGDFGEGMLRTTDAFAGNYALELRSLPGFDNSTGAPLTRPSEIGMGTFDCDVPPCPPRGGIPFSNIKDTFTFRYKYVPTISTDKARVSLVFKKLGVSIFNPVAELVPSAGYSYFEIPFQLSQAPDSVLIFFVSGDWNNTSPTFAGASLKIDDMAFKSQISTGVTDFIYQKFVKVYPNPSKGLFILQADVNVSWVEVTNATGQRVFAGAINNTRTEINLTQQPKGVYLYKVFHKGVPVARGKMVIQ